MKKTVAKAGKLKRVTKTDVAGPVVEISRGKLETAGENPEKSGETLEKEKVTR